jgi:hypothetical protein
VELDNRPFAATQVAQHPDLVMDAVPTTLPLDRVPVGRREAGIGRLLLILRGTRIAVDCALKGLADERGQRGLLEFPDIRARNPVRQRQAIHLSQDRPGVDTVSHAVHSEAHARIAIPNRPQDR